MKLLNWIKEKYQHRHAGKSDHDPWWVTLMLDVGRPVVAAMILVMSAPGEHFLAVQSGLNEKLAWGMPGTLTAYAGIAAVVATKRPKGAPGHRTAVWGAVVAVLLAMAAQPVAHLWGKFGEPSQAQIIWLTIIVGMIPAAVFGHLLHMGAVGKTKAETLKTFKIAKQYAKEIVPAERIVPASAPKPQWLSDNETATDTTGVPVSDLMSAPDRTPDAMHWTPDLSGTGPVAGQPLSSSDMTPAVPDLSDARDKIAKAFDVPVDLISGPESTLSTPSEVIYTDYRTAPAVQPRTVRSIKSGSVAADVRRFLSEHPEIVSAYRAGQPGGADADLSGHIRARWPDASWDTIRKARDRYLEKIKETS